MYSLRHRTEILLLMIAPAAITMLFVLLSAVPLRMSGNDLFMPMFSVISVFYWSLYKPRVMPYWFAFALGLVQDALFGQPLGFMSLLLLLFKALVHTQRRMLAREAFWAIWFGFAMLTFTFFSLYWMIISLYQMKVLDWQPALLQWSATAASYPLVHIFFSALHAIIPSRHFKKSL